MLDVVRNEVPIFHELAREIGVVANVRSWKVWNGSLTQRKLVAIWQIEVHES